MNGSVPDISFCIVTYQAKDYLKACLDSIENCKIPLNYEIIVVDNSSTDGTQTMLETNFPQVRIVQNAGNMGYTVPMNQAMRLGSGAYLIQLNPDTIVKENSIEILIDFMQNHPGVGVCGPKVLNSDGSLQKQCRRGEPKPLAVIGYFFKLGKIFPENRSLNEYLLAYLPEDQTSAVAGVAGSCMLIRRSVIDQIGYLDEQFFAYQEDADFCRRARQAGWEGYYVPSAEIIHYGGQGGTRVQPFRSILAWHTSYYIYYRKHLAKDYPFYFNWFYYLLIAGKLGISLLVNLFRRERFAGPRRGKSG